MSFDLREVCSEASGTPLVFLPGLFLARRLWNGVLEHCARLGRSAFVCERSFIAWVPRAMTLPQMADTLAAEFASVGIRRAIVVGGSFGGLLALEFARRRPDAVEHLVLSGVPGFGRDLRPGTTNGGLTRSVACAVAAQLFYDRNSIPAGLIDASLAEVRDPVRLPRMIHLLRVAKTYDMPTTVAEVRTPTALIWGERDSITPLARWSVVARCRDWHVTTIPGTGHAPMLERPEMFSDALQGVLPSSKKREEARAERWPSG